MFTALCCTRILVKFKPLFAQGRAQGCFSSFAFVRPYAGGAFSNKTLVHPCAENFLIEFASVKIVCIYIYIYSYINIHVYHS